MNFSVVIVSFKSFHLVEKHIQEIEKRLRYVDYFIFLAHVSGLFSASRHTKEG